MFRKTGIFEMGDIYMYVAVILSVIADWKIYIISLNFVLKIKFRYNSFTLLRLNFRLKTVLIKQLGYFNFPISCIHHVFL